MAAPLPSPLPDPAVLMDELVEEFLLRLPPEDPALLARAALVRRQWYRVVTDPSFRRRFPPGAVSTDDRPETGVAISTYEVPVADIAVSTDEGPGAGVAASANEGPGAAGMCQMPKKLKLQVQGPLSQERN